MTSTSVAALSVNEASAKVRGRARSLVRALPLVAAMIAKQTGIKIIIGGNDAYTTRNTIVLPWLDVDDVEFEAALLGYLWHECGHHRYSDLTVYEQASSKVEHKMLNILDDVFEERCTIADYPGSADRLAAVSAWLVRKGMMQPVNEQDHPARILGSYILNKLRIEELGEDVLAPYHAAAERALKAIFPVGAVVKLNALLTDISLVQSTSDCLLLAKSILKMLQDEEQKEREQQQHGDDQSQQAAGNGSQQGGDQSQQAAGNGSQQGGAQSDQQGGNPGQGAGAGQHPDQQQGNQGSNAQNGGSDDGQGAGDPQSVQSGGTGAGAGSGFADAIAKVLSASATDVGPTDLASQVRDVISSKAGSGGTVLSSVPSEEQAKSEGGGRDRLEKVRASSNQVRARLVGLVTAHREENAISRRGRTVDSRRLVRAVVGNPNLFVRKHEQENPNSAFHIVVDRSGSMGGATDGGRLMVDVALDAAMALSAALEAIEGVNVAVTAFPGSGGNVIPLQRHGEKLRKACDRFSIRASGGTPLTEAVWYAALRLVPQEQPKKILVVVTDGEPNDRGSVLDVLDRCQAAGIVCIGIGIRTEAVKRFFKHAIVINDVSELRGKLFEIAKASLMS